MRLLGNHVQRRSSLILAIVLLALLATACGASTTDPAAIDHGTMAGMDHTTMAGTTLPGDVSIETVHASYLDIASNINDLRSRVAQWQAGDESSINIAKEKLERIEILLSSTTWPTSLGGAVAKTRQAVSSMNPALNGTNLQAAVVMAKVLGDAAHDMTHDFYGAWLTQVTGQPLPAMATHIIYLDLSANINDLKSRVSAWEKGDEASLAVAKEKAERIQVLIQVATATGTLTKPLSAIQQRLPAVSTALERKDVTVATAALKPFSDASHDLTHDFYAWLGTTAGSSDPACAQAAYIDLSGNITDLKARMTAWEQGDTSSLNIAQEKMERIQAVLAHTNWPVPMAAAVGKTTAAVQAAAPVLAKPTPATSAAALKTVSDSMHDVTHAFYNDYLPQAKVAMHTPAGAEAQQPGVPAAVDDLTTGHSGSHGHAAEAAAASDDASKGWILGGFGAVNAMVIGTAAVLKTRKPARSRARKAAPQAIPSGGSAE
ncbi:MAG: hypothetical protein HZB53_19775 [Chloroflexi bacterium]|nr:hypothetical protein [Chloroflexota bacterium]